MNESIWLVLGLGFILGIKHATEADHLVCVATIVSEQRSVRRSAMIGALWGVGHTVSLLVAGVLVILLQFTMPARVAVQLELAVALMIVLLGSRALYLSLRRQRFVHVHTHTHGGRAHTHLHFHEPHDAHTIAELHAQERAGHRLTGWRPLLVGVVHGLAGSAALTLLVLTEVARSGSDLLGLAYLLLFGVGSIGGMLLMSTAISLPFVFTANRLGGVSLPIRIAAGIASVAFGIYYAWSIALGNRL
jgi:high-affinity nickel-transport protein